MSQDEKFANIIESLNKTIQAKDAKIEEYHTNITQLLEEKEKLHQEKISFMDKNNKEKLELVEKVSALEKTIQTQEQKITKFKEKSRSAEDGLLGSSMQIEQLNETIANLTQKIQDMQIELDKKESGEKPLKKGTPKEEKKEVQPELVQASKIPSSEESVSEPSSDKIIGGTGVFNTLSALISHFKYKIGNTQRTLRLIIPDITDVKENGLLEVINAINPQVFKNIACNIDLPDDKELVDDLDKIHCKLTDYKENNIYALQVDNNDIALAIFDQKHNQIMGVYSNQEQLVRLLNQAIMSPFIHGKKLRY